MKTNYIGLQDSVTAVYDKTKTSMIGKANQRTINSQQVIGAPLTKVIDVLTDTLGVVTPTYMFASPNGRLFVLGAITAGTGQVVLYNFDYSTGAHSYVGRIQYNMPNIAATTHTIRGFKVDDSNTSAIKLYIATTGSVVINSGLFLINNVALSDFVQVGFPTIGMGISSNVRAVYRLDNPAFQGALFDQTSIAGISFPYGSANAGINTKIYVHNGVSATHQYHVYENASTPSVNIVTTTGSTASGSPTFPMTSQPFAVNDPVVIIANAPTPFTLSTATTQTVYFVRNPLLNSFELSATSGGASINATSITAGTQVVRAFGQSNTMFAFKTGNLPALTGTLLATNSESWAVPQHSLNAGFDCMAFGTGSNLYLGKYSDITAGVTVWPSLLSSNVLGTGIDVTPPSPISITWLSSGDNFVMQTNANIFISKQLVNSVLKNTFGTGNNQWIEAQNPVTLPFRLLTLGGIESGDGWVFQSGATAGQRVIIAICLEADYSYDTSYIVSPIFETNQKIFRGIYTLEQLFDFTDFAVFYYRTASTNSDPIFNSEVGGWTLIETAKDLSAYALSDYTQIKVAFGVATFLSNTPAQIHDIAIVTQGLTELSEYWAGSIDNTTQSAQSPMYVAFRLTKAYASLPTKFLIKGIDDSGNTVFNFDSTVDMAVLSQSNNNGTSWSAWVNMAGFHNTALTTELRVQVLSPSGTRLTWTINEA